MALILASYRKPSSGSWNKQKRGTIMTNITVYDTEAKAIERICEDNDVTEAELIEMLMDYIDEIKAFHGWK